MARDELTESGFGRSVLETVTAVLGNAPVSAPQGSDHSAIVELLMTHRLEGLARVRGLGGAEPIGEAVDPAYRRYQIGTGLAVDASARVCRALSDAGIASLRFKGAALVASGLYDDPGARPMDDADILVPEERAREAADVLVKEGFEPWGQWNDSHASWLDSFTLSDPGAPAAFPVTIDLHWRTAYGSLRFGVVGASSLLWDGADLNDHLPAAEPHLVVVAEHVLKHLRVKTHLLAYADLVRLVGAVTDWDAVVLAARPRFLGPAVGVLLDVLRSDLGAVVPLEVIADLTSRGARVGRTRERLRPVMLISRGEDGPGRLAGLQLRTALAPSTGALASDLLASAFPDPEWLRARYGVGATWRLRARYVSACLRWAFRWGPSPTSPNQQQPENRGTSTDRGVSE